MNRDSTKGKGKLKKNMETPSFWTSPTFQIALTTISLGLAVIALGVALFALFRTWNALEESHTAILRAEAAYSTSVRKFYVDTLPYLEFNPVRFGPKNQFLNCERLPNNEVKVQYRLEVANIGIASATQIQLGTPKIENRETAAFETNAPPFDLLTGAKTGCTLSYITPIEGDVEEWFEGILASEKVVKVSLDVTYWVPYDDGRYKVTLQLQYSLNDAKVLDYKLAKIPK